MVSLLRERLGAMQLQERGDKRGASRSERDGATRERGATREGQHDERFGEKAQTTETTMTETTMTTKTVTMTMTMNDDDDVGNKRR